MGLLHRNRHEADDQEATADVVDRTGDTTAVAPAIPVQRDGRVEVDRTRDESPGHIVAPTREQPLPAPPPLAPAPTTTQPVADGDGRGEVVHEADGIPAKVRERTSVFAPGQLISLIAGGALVALGAVALVRAGLGEPLDTPVVEVLGWNHTAWLGLAEVGVGAVLMLLGTGAWGRWLSVLIGAATVVVGVVVLVESRGLPDELAVERDFGWPLVALGAAVALAAMALPVWRTTHTTMRAVDLRDDEQSRRFWSRS